MNHFQHLISHSFQLEMQMNYYTIIDGVCEAKTRKKYSTDYPEGTLMELHKFFRNCK